MGSKNFSEQILLGKITGIVLQAAGADVRDLTNIPGSVTARQALTSGQIDMMWDYTACRVDHHDSGPRTASPTGHAGRAVRDEDLVKPAWSGKPAPMNNTYGSPLLVTPRRDGHVGVRTWPRCSRRPLGGALFASRTGAEAGAQAYGVPLGTGVPAR